MSENNTGEALPNGWRMWTWANPSGGWSFELKHAGGGQVGGNQKTEDMARRIAGIIADTTIPEPAEPAAPPAWMIKVAREAVARTYDEAHIGPAAQARRDGTCDDSNEVQIALATLRLALERGHVVEPRPVPSDEEMLIAAREDAAQVGDFARPHWSKMLREGQKDYHEDVKIALQARRNMLREWGAVAVPVVPGVDLEAALLTAWSDGWTAAAGALHELHHGQGNATTLCVRQRSRNVADLLSTLPTQEA
ncbi:hypothetical protein [Methylobacterium sp. Gmos1]